MAEAAGKACASQENQDGSKMISKLAPKMAPRWAQDGPKMAPGWPQDGTTLLYDGPKVA